MDVITLSQEDVETIKEIINLNKRTGIEALLVASRAKTGDAVGLAEQHSSEIIDRLKTINGLEFIEQDDVTYYFNALLADQSVIEYLSNYSSKDFDQETIDFYNNTLPEGHVPIQWYMGKLYGYPECCINAHIKGAEQYQDSITEHFWCSPNCKESVNIKSNFMKAIMINLDTTEYFGIFKK